MLFFVWQEKFMDLYGKGIKLPRTLTSIQDKNWNTNEYVLGFRAQQNNMSS